MPGKTYLHKILFLFFGFLLTFGLQAANELDTLRFPELSESAAYFREHYRETLWNLDSTDAIREFDALLRTADRSGDKELEISILTAKGLFYQQRLPGGLTGAIEILKEALNKAEKYELIELKAKITHFIGYTYYMMEEYPYAFEYMIRADKEMKEIGYDYIHDISEYSQRLGLAYYSFGNDGKAKYYLHLASEYSNNSDRSKEVEAAILTILGNIECQDNPLQGLKWYKKALKIAEEEDLASEATVTANIGAAFLELDKPDKALPYFKRGFELCLKYEDWEMAGICLLNQALLWIDEKEVDKAEEKIRAYRSLTRKKNVAFNLTTLPVYHKIMKDIYHLLGNYKLMALYQDTLINVNDSIRARKDANMLANLEIRLMTEKHLADIAIMEEQKSKQKVVLATSWIVGGMTILLLAGIIYALYMRQKRQQKEKQMLIMENERAVERVENYKERLRFFIEGIREKNRLIEELKEKSREFDLLKGSDYGESHITGKKSLEDRLYASVILTEEDWQNFKSLFEKAYPGLIRHLQDRYPHLTTAEIRLLTLIKLNLSVSDMAKMLGISPRSVSTSRVRLWKNMGLKGYKDITVLLAKF